MSTHLTPSWEDDTTMELADSGGQRLRIARQSRGMTQEHVAKELHLNPAIIEALEREDYKSLPEPVFVTGYICKYANLVGLDPKLLMAAYEALPVRACTNHTAARAGRRRIGDRYLTLGLIGSGILLLVGILAFLWQWYQRPDLGPGTTAAEEVARETEPPDVPDTVPESGPSAFPTDLEDLLSDWEMEQAPKPGSDLETSRQPLTTTALWETAEEDADDGTTAAIDAEPMDTTPDSKETKETTVTRASEVEIVFNGPCWVDVRDSEQKHKLFGAMKKGNRHVLEGKPPHSLVLGNAAAVQITVGGKKPLDLNTVSRGNVARFTLDANGKIR